MKITALYIYPIKSLKGIAVSSSFAEVRGFRYDRRWMLVDDNGLFLSQRKFAKMALFETALVEDMIVVSFEEKKLSIPLDITKGESCKVDIWKDSCDALRLSDEADAWFSEQLGMSCRLVYMPDDSYRYVEFTETDEITSFADGFPYLLIGEASLAYLNGLLSEPISMSRFRPNIVFSGGEPHVEDGFNVFTIGDVSFRGAKLCGRCTVTTIDQETGIKGTEPLATLAKYRKQGDKIHFGQNLVPMSVGLLSVGDELKTNS